MNIVENLRNPKDSLLESSSPEPTLLDVVHVYPRDYVEHEEQGFGKIQQIGIHPREAHLDGSCLWYLGLQNVNDNYCVPKHDGYECTTILLPTSSDLPKPVLKLQPDKPDEAPTNIKPLFPYSWDAATGARCTVSNVPLTNLQFMIKRNQATAQFRVDKLDHTAPSANTENDRKLFLGLFALVYVVEGHVRVDLDENHASSHRLTLTAGETLLVHRDDDASPTTMVTRACDAQGNVGNHDAEATMVTIHISEFKQTKQVQPDILLTSNEPQPKRNITRKSSLVVYDDQPLWNLPTESAQKLLSQELNASVDAIPPTERVSGELAYAKPEDRPMRRDSLTILRGKLDEIQLYEPPETMALVEAPEPVVRDRLSIDDYPPQSVSTAWIRMVMQGLSEWIRLPVIVCRGYEEGPVVGITAAVHGNELNGVPCIHRVVADIDVTKLRGTVVAVPCVNVAGYLKFTREFADGRDLNRLFPGKEDGYASQVYCHQLMNKIISQFNYLIDLHTASFGRVNSYYVRADMNDPKSANMARLQHPQIILHNSGQDGTLRSAASARGINAITVEIGNPQLFQNQYVQWSYAGVMRILSNLQMVPLDEEDTEVSPPSTILCSKGFWIYTKTGGVLEVYPGVNIRVQKGDLIARIKNIFGNVVDEYFAPCGGIVIGRSSNPVAMSGDRIIHLGVIKKKRETLPKEAKENY